jgi:hypothetical protein
MILLLMLLGFAQAAPCPPDAAAALRESVTLARRLDLPAAAARLDPVSGRCARARIAGLYLRALQSAREAYRTGGDAASLQPVMTAIDALEKEAAAGERQAELARVILMAAAAAAQSERADMGLLLDHAVALERQMVAAGDEPAHGVTATEAAGDLWLQVHRFEAAAGAYTLAATNQPTPRITLGLARTATQMKQRDPACRAYQSFLSGWDGPASAAEVTEARAFLKQQCQDRTRQ